MRAVNHGVRRRGGRGAGAGGAVRERDGGACPRGRSCAGAPRGRGPGGALDAMPAPMQTNSYARVRRLLVLAEAHQRLGHLRL
uniref:Uncharacterized protein n=1 Tax=uncultured Armatimonadetes bacterium TaxID=157466 RepID=A0A6J4IJ45_9BACT|nr:hypothetical protein AVDCRST_MAG63-2048 [uncultured Armatimonadetes bacterium]